MDEVRTNIIYLTTHCNLDCSYCYEKKVRDTEGFVHRTLTSEEMDAFVDEVATREANTRSCVVIFGGEPLLQMGLVRELFQKFKEKKPNTSFDLVTNGTLITPAVAAELGRHYRSLHDAGSHLQIEVSYDVSGQLERAYVGGKPSDGAVLAGIGELRRAGVPFAISYVVHPLNAGSVLRDVVYCIMALKASKVTLRWATEHLEQANIRTKELQEHLRPRLLEIFRRFHVPICEAVCEACDRCHKGGAGNNYFIPGKGTLKIKGYTPNDFNHF